MEMNWLLSLAIIATVLTANILLYRHLQKMDELDRKKIVARLGKYVCAMAFLVSVGLLIVNWGTPFGDFAIGGMLDITATLITSAVCFFVFAQIERRLQQFH